MSKAKVVLNSGHEETLKFSTLATGVPVRKVTRRLVSKEDAIEDVNNMNLAQKIVRVRAEIKGFSKDKQADKYNYVSGSQALGKILKSMDRYGLLLVTMPILGTESDAKREFVRTDKYGKTKEIQEYTVKCQLEMKWINAIDGEFMVVPWLLYGQQEGDIAKAFGSGLTYSERYFIMKFFNQPTDWLDPDAKKEEEEKMNEEQKAQEEADRVANETINKQEVATIEVTLAKKRVPATEIYRQCDVSELSELKRYQYIASMQLLSSMPDRNPKVEKKVE